MTTPNKSLLRRRNSPTSASSSPFCVSSSFLNQLVFLHEWWLIKADLDFNGKRLGIGGYTSQEKQGTRRFLSAPVVERHDAVTLKTADGITILVHGPLSISRTLENGFSRKICDHFVLGFPYDWEEFAALSFDKDKMPTPEYDGSSTLKSIFDDILQQNDGATVLCNGAIGTKVSTPDETPSKYKRKLANQNREGDNIVEDVKRSGPLTRSRTRLLDKYVPVTHGLPSVVCPVDEVCRLLHQPEDLPSAHREVVAAGFPVIKKKKCYAE